MLPGVILLIVPLAIIPAYRRATSPVVVSGALTIIAFAVFWLVLGGVHGMFATIVLPGVPIGIVIFYGGIVLALATWVLAINAAAQARRWVWVALLVVAGYLTLAAIYSSFSLLNCVPEGPYAADCSPPDMLTLALVALGYFACPVAALFFGIRPSWRRGRTLPEGLVATSLLAEKAEHPIDVVESSE